MEKTPTINVSEDAPFIVTVEEEMDALFDLTHQPRYWTRKDKLGRKVFENTNARVFLDPTTGVFTVDSRSEANFIVFANYAGIHTEQVKEKIDFGRKENVHFIV